MVCGFKDWILETENETDYPTTTTEIDAEDSEDFAETDSESSDEDQGEDSYDGPEHESIKITQKITMGERIRISCSAHTLQLVIKDVMRKGGRPTEVLECAYKIVKYFMRSSYWRKRLKKVVGKVLIKPAATRWNYTYYVLERLCQVLHYTPGF